MAEASASLRLAASSRRSSARPSRTFCFMDARTTVAYGGADTLFGWPP